MIVYRWFPAIVALALAMGACQNEPAAPSLSATLLASVVPAGRATGVDPTSKITVEFTHGMME